MFLIPGPKCQSDGTLVTYNPMVVYELTDDATDRIFQAMADATRRDIVARVMNAEYSVSRLAEHYAMSFAAVQKHVAVLERAALVNKRRRGREQLVTGNAETLNRATRLLESYEQIWIDRTRAIAELLATQ
ncbi:MAG: metalloregulator ArsR/SmtB family transcription factor [Candidatus Nanopelagicales bacterium]